MGLMKTKGIFFLLIGTAAVAIIIGALHSPKGPAGSSASGY
jgi:hypothetical protein